MRWNHQETKKKKALTCFPDLSLVPESLRETLTALELCATSTRPAARGGKEGRGELPGRGAPLSPPTGAARRPGRSGSPPPCPAPRAWPDRRVSTAGAGPPPLLPPARAHTKAREPAEEERPRPPQARPYPAAPPPAAPAAVPDRRAPPRGRHGCCYCSSGRDRCRRSSPAALTALTPPGAAAKPALGPPSDPGSARHCVPAHAGRRRRALRQQREGVKLVGGLSSHVVPAEAGCSYYRCGRCSSHLQYEAAQ